MTAVQRVAVSAKPGASCLRWLVGWGGYWRWLRAPLLVERISIRRVRRVGDRTRCCWNWCSSIQRLDAVEVIGDGLVRKLTSGLGLRLIAEQLDMPYTRLRSWWRRFRVRSPILLARCTALAVALDGTPVEVNTVPSERAALHALSVAWQRAQIQFVGRRSNGSGRCG